MRIKKAESLNLNLISTRLVALIQHQLNDAMISCQPIHTEK